MFPAESRPPDKLTYFDDARKYETGTIAYSLFDAWTAGLELILEIGIENIYSIALENTDLLIAGLHEKGYQIVTTTKNWEEATAIVHFNTASYDTTKALYEKLINECILLTL